MQIKTENSDISYHQLRRPLMILKDKMTQISEVQSLLKIFNNLISIENYMCDIAQQMFEEILKDDLEKYIHQPLI